MQPAAAIVGVATALCIVVVARRWRNAPAYLIGLACGTALWFAMDAGVPASDVGHLVGAIPGSLGTPWLAPETALDLVREHAVRVLTTSLVIAVVGAMDTLLAAVAVDSATVERHDSNRVLRGQGLANVVAGALGGTPVSYSTAIALATARAGGRGALAAIIGSVALLVAAIAGRPLLAMLPLAALAGVMVAVAASLTDRWTRVVARQALAGHANAETAWGLAVVVLVCAVTVAFGFIAAVAAGVIVSMALFIGAMNRSLVRTRATAATRASRRSYPPEATRFLRTHGERIRTLDLEGALFFGTAERLAIEVESLAGTARFVVLDLRRVTTIDASGAVILERLWRQLARRGVDLLLGGVGTSERHGIALLACGTFADAATRPWYATSDEALEHAERRLLTEAGGIAEGARIAIEDVAMMQGLDDAARRSLVAHLHRLDVPAGTRLFRAGDPGDRLYVLTEGSVSIRYRSEGRDHRLITCAPGVVFGEIALLDGAGRSADAVADDDSVVYELTQAQLDDIQAREPALAAQLMLEHRAAAVGVPAVRLGEPARGGSLTRAQPMRLAQAIASARWALYVRSSTTPGRRLPAPSDSCTSIACRSSPSGPSRRSSAASASAGSGSAGRMSSNGTPNTTGISDRMPTMNASSARLSSGVSAAWARFSIRRPRVAASCSSGLATLPVVQSA